MQIAILGAGAMGMLFGGYLSRNNDVTLLDVDRDKVRAINEQGVRILEPDGTEAVFHPKAAETCDGMPLADLVLVFVKSLYSKNALTANRRLIGPNTRLMTLQNGSGHEVVLGEFAGPEQIIIGTTQHNSSFLGSAVVQHGGIGVTSVGLLAGDSAVLEPLAKNFTGCGIETAVSSQIKRMIWEKMFTNISASVLTGILQTPLGFLVDSEHGWALTRLLLRESVQVANKEGMDFDEQAVVDQVHSRLCSSRDGITSICADLRDGRKTEVDTINGSVVEAGRKSGIPTPCHEFVVHLVHALEDKNDMAKKTIQEGNG